MSTTWVLASSNPGKLKEFEQALAPALRSREIQLINQSSLGIDPAEEPYDSFEKNALAKARHASRAAGCPAIADDSGIVVPLLGGAPGVRSARFFADAAAAENLKNRAQIATLQSQGLNTDALNLHWLLYCVKCETAARQQYWSDPGAAAAGIAGEITIDAAFYAAIAFVRSADDADPLVVHGRWDGALLPNPRGQHGFGYDPVFFDLQLKMSAAEMTIEQKRQVSHRGQALGALLQRLAF
jgi:XTP/dITP diphosphohydrolase